MIKKEKGKFVLYKGKKKIGVFGNEKVAQVWERLFEENKKK
jgi:hypothetical protein